MSNKKGTVAQTTKGAQRGGETGRSIGVHQEWRRTKGAKHPCGQQMATTTATTTTPPTIGRNFLAGRV